MTRQQAIAKLTRMYGKARAYYRVGAEQTSPEARADALARCRAARERKDAIDAEIARRLAELDWYQALKAERREAVDAISRTSGEISNYRFSIGRITLGFAEITGSGDTWEEAFARAESKTSTTASAAEPTEVSK